MKTCPSCGTKSESKFCPECGTDLSSVQDVKVCPNCGTESTSKFCPECGTNLLEPVSIIESTDTVEENEPPVIEAMPDTPQISEQPMVEPTPEASIVVPDTPQPNEEQKQGISDGIPVGGFVPPQENKPKKPIKKILIIVGAILLLLIIIGVIAGGGDEDTSSTTPTNETESYYEEEEETTEATTTEPTTEEFVDEFTKEEDYKDISYDKLARNPDDYEYELVKGSGNVLQVMDGDDEVDLRIGTSSDGYDDVVLAYYDPRIVDSRILEDDQVTYYGQSLGLYTYESTMGGEITIPLIKIHKIKRD